MWSFGFYHRYETRGFEKDTVELSLLDSDLRESSSLLLFSIIINTLHSLLPSYFFSTLSRKNATYAN